MIEITRLHRNPFARQRQSEDQPNSSADRCHEIWNGVARKERLRQVPPDADCKAVFRDAGASSYLRGARPAAMVPIGDKGPVFCQPSVTIADETTSLQFQQPSMIVMGGIEAHADPEPEDNADVDPLAESSDVRRTSLIDKTVGAFMFCGMFIAMSYVGASASSLLVITLFVLLAIAAVSGSAAGNGDSGGSNAMLHSFQRFPHDERVGRRDQ